MGQLYKYVTNKYDADCNLKLDYQSVLQCHTTVAEININWSPSCVNMNLQNSSL